MNEQQITIASNAVAGLMDATGSQLGDIEMTVSEHPECPNCKERKTVCACLRNTCLQCGFPVGNITFSVCDSCWDAKPPNNRAEPPEELVLIKRILSLIDIRRRTVQSELNEAIERKQWSKVPGWDGIDIGLMMAEKTIKEEMQ
jgi:hypothetical protein